MTDPRDANRRPLSFRAWRVFAAVAAKLATAGVTPNAISVSSMVFAGIAAACLVGTTYTESFSLEQRVLWIAAGLLIQLRLIANMLDGMVAIEGGIESPIGELFNEVPDRVSDVAVLVAAGYAAASDPRLGFSAAIVAVFIAYVRAIGASVGAGQQFLGLMAKQQRMTLVTLAAALHGLLPATWNISFGAGYGWMAAALVVIILGGAVTAIRRLLRIATLMRQSGNR